jgi:hypothetical protein
MRKLTAVIAFAALALALALAAPPGRSAGQPPAAVPKWEYKLLVSSGPHFLLETKDFNELGAEGWELAAAPVTPGGIEFLFKRPKR